MLPSYAVMHCVTSASRQHIAVQHRLSHIECNPASCPCGKICDNQAMQRQHMPQTRCPSLLGNPQTFAKFPIITWTAVSAKGSVSICCMQTDTHGRQRLGHSGS